MAYPISTTKLITYQTCAKAYQLRFERGLGSPAMFGSPDLGNALHKAMATAYRDWHYNDHKPTWEWFETCWTNSIEKLSEKANPRRALDARRLLLRFRGTVGSHGKTTRRRRVAFERRCSSRA